MRINPFYLHGEEMTPVRKLLALHALAGGAPLVKYTETGNPVTFETNVAKPMSVVAAFSPVQAGTGDPSPDNVRSISGFSSANLWRTGKNLLDSGKKYASGTAMCFLGALDGTFPYFLKAGQYTFSIEFKNGVHYGAYFREKNDVSETKIFAVADSITTKAFSIPKDGHSQFFSYRGVAQGGVDEQNIGNFQLEPGDIATAYEPYTGQSVSVTFPALGANRFNGVWEQGNIAAGRNEPSTTAMRTGFIDVDPSTAYYAYTTRTANIFLFEYDEDGTYLNIVTNISNGKSFTTSAATKKVRIADRNSGTESVNTGINYPATVTTYEPYNATAYGGTLDLSTGVLTVEYKDFTKTWGDYIAKTVLGDNTRGVLSIANYPSKTVGQAADAKCNIAPRGTGWSEDSIHFYTNEGSCIVILPNDTDDSTEIQVVYPLATPLVYQLSPAEILSLVGDNVIWSDLNGDLTVVYKKRG